MENRKELSIKSKKLILKQFNSDILNKSTGYYMKEHIFPITQKPNERKINLKQFIPNYKEIKLEERRFNNTMSERQRNNSFIIKHMKLESYKNQQLEDLRKRSKTIKDCCYDEKGRFSSKKRYIFEFYGTDKLLNLSNNNIEYNKKNNQFKKRKNFRELILKSRNNNNSNYDFNDSINYENNYNNSYINPNYEQFNTINYEKENSTFNNLNYKKNILFIHNNKNVIKEEDKEAENNNIYNDNEKLSRNKIPINYYLSTMTNYRNPGKIFNRIKTDLNYPNINLYNTQTNNNNINTKQKKEFYYHAKDISKLFYSKTNNPVKNIRIRKADKNIEDKEHYNLEFKYKCKNNEERNKINDNFNQKKLKEIFYNNGLHIYDFNEDGMNILSINKKMEAKLRKKKFDENFDKKIKTVIKILEKNGINVEKYIISNDKGFQNKVIVKKKRKGTPGTILYDNRFHKDENTKINTGIGNKEYKRRIKNIIPQYDKNYKNFYKYNKEKYKK